MKRRFKQVDVFGVRPFMGNPVAVILDGEGLADTQMAAIATWTNLSETTFLFPPERGGDYRLRIFTPKGELPFAGHPTLGSAHAFLEAAGRPEVRCLVQECGVGLVRVVAAGEPGGDDRMLSFEAPAVSATALPGSAAQDLLRALGAEGIPPPHGLIMDVGPRWCVFDLGDGATVTRLAPDMGLLTDLSHGLKLTGVTVFGRRVGSEPSLRVRSFAPAAGVPEDPACGSGNVCVGAYLAKTSRLQDIGTRYTATQGQEMGRDARLVVSVTSAGSRIDVAGRTTTLVDGIIDA